MKNNNIIFSGHCDGSVCCWDIKDKEMAIWKMRLHTATVTSITSFEDRMFCSGSKDNTIALFSRNGKLIRYLKGHEKDVTSVRYVRSNDLCSASEDETIRIWNTENGKTTKYLEDHNYGTALWCLCEIPNRFLVSGDDNGRLLFWDLNSYHLKKKIRVHKNWVYCVNVCSFDESVVSSSYGRTVKINNFETGKVTHKFVGDIREVYSCFELENDTQLIATGSNHFIVQIWDKREEECVQTIKCQGWVYSLLQISDRLLMAGLDRSPFLISIDLRNGKTLKEWKNGNESRVCALHKSKELLITATVFSCPTETLWKSDVLVACD